MKLFPKWKDQKTWQKFANVFALIFLAACLIIIMLSSTDRFDDHIYLISVYVPASIFNISPIPILIYLWPAFYFYTYVSPLLPSLFGNWVTAIIVGTINYYLIGALIGALIGLIIGKFKKPQDKHSNNFPL